MRKITTQEKLAKCSIGEKVILELGDKDLEVVVLGEGLKLNCSCPNVGNIVRVPKSVMRENGEVFEIEYFPSGWIDSLFSESAYRNIGSKRKIAPEDDKFERYISLLEKAGYKE
jgi:hypothetical protein